MTSRDPVKVKAVTPIRLGPVSQQSTITVAIPAIAQLVVHNYTPPVFKSRHKNNRITQQRLVPKNYNVEIVDRLQGGKRISIYLAVFTK